MALGIAVRLWVKKFESEELGLVVPMLKCTRPRVTPPLTTVRVCKEFARPEVLNKTTSKEGIVVGMLVLIEGSPLSRM